MGTVWSTPGCAADSKGVGVFALGDVLVLVEGCIGESLQAATLVQEYRNAFRRDYREEVVQYGLQTSGDLWRPGTGEADLVEGQVHVVLPVHRRDPQSNRPVLVSVVAGGE